MSEEDKNIMYFNLVQTDIEKFNEHTEKRRKEFIEIHGKDEFYKILHGNRHHELRAHRTVAYNLSDEEKKELYSKGFLIKDTEDMTFEQVYVNLYNNDMPVVITSDSLLTAFHKFYDDWLKELEVNELIPKMIKLCKDVSIALREAKAETPKAKEMLKYLEIVVNVPLVILNLQQKLSADAKTINYQSNARSKDTINFDSYSDYPRKESGKVKNLVEKELSEGFSLKQNQAENEVIDQNKLELFKRYYEVNSYYLNYWLEISPKLKTYFKDFTAADCTVKPQLVHNSIEELNELVLSILKYKDVKLYIENELVTDLTGTMMKPRGHYTESFELEKYFMAFKWLSMFIFDLKKSDVYGHIKCQPNALALAVLTTRFVKSDMFAEFDKIVQIIMGTPSGYNVDTFTELVKEHVDLISVDTICDSEFCEDLFKKIESKLKHNEMSIISQGISIDYTVYDHMVDSKFMLNDGTIPMRKYPRIHDVLATVFSNKAVISKDCDYSKHISTVSKKCDDHRFGDGVYDYELRMLRALVEDQKKMEEIGWWPFYTDSWNKKLANTQAGHYAEVRHDNVLYCKEFRGGGLLCEYPDLLVEPVPTFWNEFLALIKKMQSLNRKENYYLLKFENITKDIIVYLKCQMEGTPIDPELEERIKCIANVEYEGSGGPDYTGWYCGLIKDPFKFKPEISTIFTGVPDDRDDGGVIHLGTGPVRLLYVLSKNPHDGQLKVFLGPVYSSYEFKTSYSVRHNDEEWMREYTKYKPLEF